MIYSLCYDFKGNVFTDCHCLNYKYSRNNMPCLCHTELAVMQDEYDWAVLLFVSSLLFIKQDYKPT